MLRRFFTPAPDSMFLMCSKGRKGRWMVLWNLIWVFWMFGDLLFGMPLPKGWWPVTLGAVAVFLLLYSCANVRPVREVPAYAFALVAVGCLVMPISRYASGTCLIYACVYLSLQPTVRRVLAFILPAMLVWVVEAQLLHWPWQATGWILILSLAVSIGQHSVWVGLRKNAELRLSHDEVRRLAATAERERIGRDLHDLLGHTLSMVALKSELAGRLIESDPAAARREIADVQRVARDALSQVRSAVSGIRAAALASELAAARLLLETAGVRMDYWCDPRTLPSEPETCLALVLREAVTNVQRHARANRVEVTVFAGTERVVMRVRDDGRGGVHTPGNGLAGMRERIVAQGGELTIESPRGHGTSIEVWLPLPDAPKERLDEVAPATPQPVGGAVVQIGRRAGSHA
ncbi:MAG TPA: sensor histidine kinase [Rhodanobacteraceae bacterium]|nr:sensor histidine kinase [Rhodanobacteraceae bacterium]